MMIYSTQFWPLYNFDKIDKNGLFNSESVEYWQFPITHPVDLDKAIVWRFIIIKKAMYIDIYRDWTFDNIHWFYSSIWNTITRENHACAPSQRVIVLSLFILKTKYCYSIEAPGHPTLIDLCWPWLVETIQLLMIPRDLKSLNHTILR